MSNNSAKMSQFIWAETSWFFCNHKEKQKNCKSYNAQLKIITFSRYFGQAVAAFFQLLISIFWTCYAFTVPDCAWVPFSHLDLHFWGKKWFVWVDFPQICSKLYLIASPASDKGSLLITPSLCSFIDYWVPTFEDEIFLSLVPLCDWAP